MAMPTNCIELLKAGVLVLDRDKLINEMGMLNGPDYVKNIYSEESLDRFLEETIDCLIHALKNLRMDRRLYSQDVFILYFSGYSAYQISSTYKRYLGKSSEIKRVARYVLAEVLKTAYSKNSDNVEYMLNLKNLRPSVIWAFKRSGITTLLEVKELLIESECNSFEEYVLSDSKKIKGIGIASARSVDVILNEVGLIKLSEEDRLEQYIRVKVKEYEKALRKRLIKERGM